MTPAFKDFKVKSKVQIKKDNVFFGPGLVEVLKNVNEAGSVKEAGRRTGISYSKIWTIIRRAEGETGIQLVERHRGGIDGGVAHTTKECDELLELYAKLSDKVDAYAQKEFAKIFK